jgi:EAL domain-containing protein (putative c-di-GMP-specific phosphodiesterase class I)
MSALEFSALDLLDSMLLDLRNYGLPTQFLTLELIETVLLKSETKETMQHLHDAGLSLVLDDFGTGFSSLSYLLHFPVNGVKIDRSFIVGLPHHEDSRRVVSVILQMAATLQLSVVAEGVETLEQADWLTEHGCTRFQGYYFGRPMGVSAIGKHLQSQHAVA